MNRFVEQARQDYEGTPNAIATVTDDCGETIVLVRCVLDDGSYHYLGWIGGEYAESPDEFGEDLPYEDVKWSKI